MSQCAHRKKSIIALAKICICNIKTFLKQFGLILYQFSCDVLEKCPSFFEQRWFLWAQSSFRCSKYLKSEPLYCTPRTSYVLHFVMDFWYNPMLYTIQLLMYKHTEVSNQFTLLPNQCCSTDREPCLNTKLISNAFRRGEFLHWHKQTNLPLHFTLCDVEKKCNRANESTHSIALCCRAFILCGIAHLPHIFHHIANVKVQKKIIWLLINHPCLRYVELYSITLPNEIDAFLLKNTVSICAIYYENSQISRILCFLSNLMDQYLFMFTVNKSVKQVQLIIWVSVINSCLMFTCVCVVGIAGFSLI